jgi:hypothetical protein
MPAKLKFTAVNSKSPAAKVTPAANLYRSGGTNSRSLTVPNATKVIGSNIAAKSHTATCVCQACSLILSHLLKIVKLERFWNIHFGKIAILNIAYPVGNGILCHYQHHRF